MADIDDEIGSQNENEHADDDDVWEDPVEDIESLDDGARTIIVGGSSRIETIDDALERYRGPGDRIIIMPGVYETGMILDAGRFPRLQITGAFPAKTEAEERAARQKQKELEARRDERDEEEEEALNRWLPPPVFGPERSPVVVFKGKLNVQYQQSTAARYEDDDEEAEAEGGHPALGSVRKLTVSNIAFQGGASISEEADIVLKECNFGIPYVEAPSPSSSSSTHGERDDSVREQRTVRVHALATPTFNRCRVFGAERSAIYCYPYARGVFNNCDVVGMINPPPGDALSGQNSRTRRLLMQQQQQQQQQSTSSSSSSSPSSSNKPPLKCLSDAGIHLDDAACTFHQCSVKNFNIGIVTNDPCEGTKFAECLVSEVASVAYLIGANCKANLRECKSRLSGREALVVGPRAHVSIRDCLFSGDVRLKEEAILTSLVDNIVGPESSNWKIMNEAKQFSERGFKIVEEDPSLRKKRKPVPVDE